MFNNDQKELKNRPSAMNNTIVEIRKKNSADRENLIMSERKGKFYKRTFHD